MTAVISWSVAAEEVISDRLT